MEEECERDEEAKDALEAFEDSEEEEADIEEVEDLLQYYQEKIASVQVDAQRYLDIARDLEESISVSLSARRFEVLSLCSPRGRLERWSFF
jgi:hypothetical protein